MNGFKEPHQITLHVFCDASKVAYATCIFMRIESVAGVAVQLIQAKTRVAPLKPTTIPRLELLACCIGARLADNVKQGLSDQHVQTSYWTDSSNAICWITSEEPWTTFVWNRVKEIRKLSDPANWHHVAGDNNPADLPSRGCTVKQLLKSKWWEGPDWLKKPSSEWPNSTIKLDQAVLNHEKRKTVVTSLSRLPFSNWISTFSSYWKIIRILAWIRRFLQNAKPTHVRVVGTLTLEELEQAENILLRITQKESFSGPTDKRLRALQLLRDSSGTLRVRTRLLLREDSEDFKHPILLPNDHPVVKLLIQWWHQKLLHGGVQTLVAQLREHYWILKGRQVIRKAVRECKQCRRFDAKSLDAVPGPLPQERVRDAAVFDTTGVDLAGPLFLKGGNKVWVVLFTCAVYRAVHLELVMSLSTVAFLRALRRFVARRGRPSTIFSDNGTNFVGTENAFKNLDWDKICDQSSVQRISWKFNPPTAAWWGGWWERLVGMMKRLLRRVLGKASLTYEELETVLCDCESVLNSRPLTYQSEESEDLVPLTPVMFMRDLRGTGLPEVDAMDHQGLNRRQRHCQAVRLDLRKRFRGEYLAQLRQRWNPSAGESTVAVGDIVLVGSDDRRRMEWPLARVVAVHPGPDGRIRVFRVKTARGELVRPIQRLFPLEVGPSKRLAELGPISMCQEEKPGPPCNISTQVTRSGRRVKPPERLGL